MSDGPPAGHIKVSRKVFDAEHGDPFWNEPREFSRWEAWIDLIQLAAFKDSNYRTSGGVIPLKRGEVVASLRYMAKRWSWSVKKVRGFFAKLEKTDRVRAQEGHTSGTRYLITKYDAYQSTPEAKGTGKGIDGAQAGHKIEAVKAVRPKKHSVAGAPESGLAVFPKADCDAAHARWVAKIGAVNYGRFRAALLSIFVASPLKYTGDQLAAAVEAFDEARTAIEPKYRGSWNVNRFGAELHEWVRLGAMELIDHWGIPTERGRAMGMFAA